MPDDEEVVTEFNSLKDLFKGVFKKVMIDDIEYIMIPHSMMQRVTDFIIVLDIKIKLLEEATGLREKEKTYTMKQVDELLKERDEKEAYEWEQRERKD